jgi:hypothetical protein
MNDLPQFTTHAGTCKTCGTGLLLKIASDCPPLHLEHWLPLGTCNRCADFIRLRRKLADRIKLLCESLFSLRITSTKQVNPELVDKIQTKLSDLTRRIAHATCKFYMIGDVWTSDFVTQLMEKPNKHDAILAAYESQVKRLHPKPTYESEPYRTTNDP